MKFVKIKAGSFLMGGSAGGLGGAEEDELPRHEVTLTQDYWIGAHEVTQAQWEELMGGSHNSGARGPGLPVSGVTYGQAEEFIRRLNEREGAEMYRLPTEAEWECAARAGSEGAWHFGEDPLALFEFDWADKSARSPQAAGLKKPNPWGLHDVHGNVKEMVSDYYGANYYESSPPTDPQGPLPDEDGSRVVRGGAWLNSPERTRSSYRYFLDDGKADANIGLRLAFTDGAQPKQAGPEKASPEEAGPAAPAP
jgi:formylglycine-generating enzyme required for sulfatase activity